MPRSSVAPTRFVSDLVVDELVGRARIALPISVASGTVPSRRYAIGLWLLFFLFAFRVVAQPLALVVHSAVLPPFESWHSAALPYGVLLASQIAILVALGWTAWRFTVGDVDATPCIGHAGARIGRPCISLTMVVRLVLGAHGARPPALVCESPPNGVSPGSRGVPAALWAFPLRPWKERRRTDNADLVTRLVQTASVPALPGRDDDDVRALRRCCEAQGASLVVSTYVPVLLAAAMVTLLELKFPHRSEWRPPVSEVKTDLGFMTIVQLAFPPLMGFVFTYALIAPARALNLPISALWPHAWPIWIQALLMVLAVDFLRYWLHRAAHQNDTLWRLHSVHHSVEQLYWLNTARFHLLEKAHADDARQPAVPADGGGANGARALLRRVRDQRILSALQHRAPLRRPQLHRRQRRNAPVASLAGFRANRTPTTATP